MIDLIVVCVLCGCCSGLGFAFFSVTSLSFAASILSHSGSQRLKTPPRGYSNPFSMKYMEAEKKRVDEKGGFDGARVTFTQSPPKFIRALSLSLLVQV